MLNVCREICFIRSTEQLVGFGVHSGRKFDYMLPEFLIFDLDSPPQPTLRFVLLHLLCCSLIRAGANCCVLPF